MRPRRLFTRDSISAPASTRIGGQDCRAAPHSIHYSLHSYCPAALCHSSAAAAAAAAIRIGSDGFSDYNYCRFKRQHKTHDARGALPGGLRFAGAPFTTSSAPRHHQRRTTLCCRRRPSKAAYAPRGAVTGTIIIIIRIITNKTKNRIRGREVGSSRREENGRRRQPLCSPCRLP